MNVKAMLSVALAAGLFFTTPSPATAEPVCVPDRACRAQLNEALETCVTSSLECIKECHSE